MKTKLQFLLAILVFSAHANAQEFEKTPQTIPGLSKTFDNYLKDVEKTKENFLDRIRRTSKASQDNSDTVKAEKQAYNPKMLNLLIANNIGSYVTGAKDLSLQEIVAVVDSDDKSLFVGYNINVGAKNKIDNLTHVFNIGAKLKTKDDYAKIRDKNGYADEIGLNLKYTYLFGGKISFDRKLTTKLRDYRELYLKKQFEAELKKYESLKSDTEIEAYDSIFKPTNDQLQQKIEETYITLYEKIAASEEKFITENNLYSSVSKWWLTFNAYIPVTNKHYQVSPVMTNPLATTYKFQNFSFKTILTYMKKWNDRKILYLSGSASLFNNNNIIANNMSPTTYQVIVEQTPNNQAIAESFDNIYVGDFHQGYTKGLKADMVCFFIKDYAGLSAAVERNYSNFESTNWKLGLPLSLKDRDDKPTVNLELHWKEYYKSHSVGISIGYVFGKSLK